MDDMHQGSTRGGRHRGSLDVFIVSKPLASPLRDGTSVHVDALVRGLPADIHVTYFGDPRVPRRTHGRVIERAGMRYAPGFMDKALMLPHLLDPRGRGSIVHFFFTPNRSSSLVLSGLRPLLRRRSMVQSVMSSTGAEAFASGLDRLDAVIVHSRWAAHRLIAAGLRDDRVHIVHPGVRVPARDELAPRPPRESPRLLYAGDLDLAVADRLLAVVDALSGRLDDAPWGLDIAVRPKGGEYAPALERLRGGLSRAEAGDRVRLLGEVDDMPSLLREADVQLFLADHVERKVDLPLVLLEGLARGTPFVTTPLPSIREILEAAREEGLEVGHAVETAPPAALAEAVLDAVSRLSDPMRRADAQLLAARRFAADRMVAAHREIYETLS